MGESLAQKHRPESFDDIYGHPKAISKIKEWAENWSKGDSPLLLHGPAGTGKTSTAEVVSNEFDWEYVETNASSSRKTEDIEYIAQEIRSRNNTLTLYVFDEVDSIDGRSISTLYPILKNSPNPVICTANELWKVPDGLENICKNYKFKLKSNSIKKYLKDIVKEEDIDISSRQIGQLATRNGIRDALNDLQAYSIQEKDTEWDGRETDDSPFAVTRRVILNKDYLGDMTPDDMVSFLNENVKNEMDGVESMRSYQALSEADKWLRHTQKTQNYSWWRYAGDIAEEVSNLRLTEPYNDWVNVDYPSERRNYTPSASSENREARFYRSLKDEYSFSGGFGFREFRKIVLPLIKSMSEEEKRELILSNGIPQELIDVIGLSKSEYEDWQMQEVEKETDTNDTESTKISEFISKSTEDGEKDDSDSEKGIFSY